MAVNLKKEIEKASNSDYGIYELKLHESIILTCGICVMRVPGGWLYDCWDLENNQFKIGIYIPWHNDLLNDCDNSLYKGGV